MTSCSELPDILDHLCPMYLILDQDGVIQKAGATLRKLRPDREFAGVLFTDLFEVARPKQAQTIGDLMANSGARLKLYFHDQPRTSLKGIIVLVPGGAVVNLSFGISLLDAVRDYALTSADFSATDLAIELLYLVEAKSAAMEASRMLNQRLQGAMIAAEEQAFTDTLTGLKNRRALDHILARLTACGDGYAVMNLDLDFFKAVNDTLGHAAGDHVLQHVARIMVEETRASDTIARAGGDEFVLVFDKLQDQRILETIGRRLIDRIEVPIPFGGEICKVSASIGVAITPGGGDPADVLHQADTALYAAKRAGRACLQVYQAVT